MVITAIARLHGMRDQRLDLHDLALAGRAGDAHAWLCHHVFLQLLHHSSMQAPSVTTMSAVADRTEPSCISARASTVCDRQANLGADFGLPRPHSQMIGGRYRLRIAFDKDVDTQHVVVGRHGTVNCDRERHGVPRLGEWWQAQSHTVRLRRAVANTLADSLLHSLWRRPGTSWPQCHQHASGAEPP